MVTSPLGQDLPLKVNASPDDKDCDLIEFVPSLPGNYRFNITYGGEEVPGSPVMFTVEEVGVARAYGEGLSGGRVGSPVSFKVRTKNKLLKHSFNVVLYQARVYYFAENSDTRFVTVDLIISGWAKTAPRARSTDQSPAGKT